MLLIVLLKLTFLIAFTMEQDIPDYDMDSDDEKWINSQAGKLDITPLQVWNKLISIT
jgi:enhancer of polycomb-like protein